MMQDAASTREGRKAETVADNVVEVVDAFVGPHRGRDEGDHKSAGHAHACVAPAQSAHPEPVGVYPETESPGVLPSKYLVDAPALSGRGFAQKFGTEDPTIEKGLVECGEGPGLRAR
jgi:hypothetical protein